MVTTFFQSAHCVTATHCGICRQLYSGRAFRVSLLNVFPSLGEVDFACPAGKPWQYAIATSSPSENKVIKGLKAMAAEIARLPGNSEQTIFLRAMSKQLLVLAAEHRGGSCQDGVGYQRRLIAKLSYYIREYGPAELALQLGLKPAAAPMQTSTPVPDRQT